MAYTFTLRDGVTLSDAGFEYAGERYDVDDELAAGSGTITTDDPLLAERLRALKAPDGGALLDEDEVPSTPGPDRRSSVPVHVQGAAPQGGSYLWVKTDETGEPTGELEVRDADHGARTMPAAKRAAGEGVAHMAVFGHSYGVGHLLATPAVQRATSLLAAELGVSESNYAVNSSRLTDMTQGTATGAHTLLSRRKQSYRSPQLALLWWGVNDVGWHGDVAKVRSSYQTMLRGMVRRLGAGFVADDQHASQAYSASWITGAATNAVDQNTARITNPTAGNGQTVTITLPGTFPGGDLDLIAGAWGSTSGATYAVTVDGVSAGTFDLRPYKTSDQNLGGAFPVAYRLSNLTPGAHTIVATVANFDFQVNWEGWQVPLKHPPLILVPSINYFPTYSYYSGARPGGGTYTTPTDEMIDAYNAAISSVCDEFPNVVFIDSNEALVDPKDPGLYNADGLHPNAAGHALLADAFATAIDSAGLGGNDLLRCGFEQAEYRATAW